MALSPSDKQELCSALRDFVSGEGSFGFLRVAKIARLAKEARTDPDIVPAVITELAFLLPTDEASAVHGLLKSFRR